MKTIDFHLFNGESTCCFNAYDESVWRIDGIAKAFTDFSKCHIPYTFKHYLAFRKVEKQLLGENVYWHHDWDKLFMFIFFLWLGQRAINQFHQKHQRHHPTYASGKDWKRNLKNPLEVDFLQAVIDWECARITKTDKQLDACDTMRKFYIEYADFVTPILKKLNIYHD